MKNKIFKLIILLFGLFVYTNVYADDYSDDVYDGDYSLYEMLENYNLITFGKKELDDSINIANFSKGGARLFHINSRFLINGNLNIYRFDFLYDINNFKSYAKTLSHQGRFFFCGWNGGNNNCGVTSSYSLDNLPDKLYTSTQEYLYINGNASSNKSTGGEYMNFDRLYDSIVDEQSKIRKGKTITAEGGVAHVETGGEYYIDDISDIESIMFDNFEANEDDLTIITINNSGKISFPKIYETAENGEGNLVSTNDYMGMERPNSEYAEFFVLNKYYGNIIWNLPNATYIELPSAPFIGHLVAPKADVTGPELHYAGAFLVNSLYIQGNSEAHFYPLTSTNIPYREDPLLLKAATEVDEKQGSIKFKNGIDPNLIDSGSKVTFNVVPEDGYVLSSIYIEDEEKNNVEYNKIGKNEYEFTMPDTDVVIFANFEKKNIKNIINNMISNPETGDKLLIIMALMIFSILFVIYFIKGIQKNKYKI